MFVLQELLIGNAVSPDVDKRTLHLVGLYCQLLYRFYFLSDGLAEHHEVDRHFSLNVQIDQVTRLVVKMNGPRTLLFPQV